MKQHTSDCTGCTNLYWTLKTYVIVWPTVQVRAANCIDIPIAKVA